MYLYSANELTHTGMGIWKNTKVLLCVSVGLSSGKVIRAIQRLNGFKGEINDQIVKPVFGYRCF